MKINSIFCGSAGIISAAAGSHGVSFGKFSKGIVIGCTEKQLLIKQEDVETPIFDLISRFS